jgi:hypothetical protein
MRQLILFTIFFILTPIAMAEDSPLYNFATTQANPNIIIQPGETLRMPAIYFFNIYGNRITHVSLSLTDFPKGWNVKLEPEMHETQVNISGTMVTANENLYVSPSQPVKEVPVIVPEGMTYITLGGVEGSVPAKVAYLNITVPPDTPLGSTYSISVKAVGSWFGQAATLALSQERSFDFKVQTAAHNFTEEIVQPKPEDKKDSNSLIFAAVFIFALAAMGIGFYAGRKKK